MKLLSIFLLLVSTHASYSESKAKKTFDFANLAYCASKNGGTSIDTWSCSDCSSTRLAYALAPQRHRSEEAAHAWAASSF